MKNIENKKEFVSVFIEVVHFEEQDVVRTSGFETEGDDFSGFYEGV